MGKCSHCLQDYNTLNNFSKLCVLCDLCLNYNRINLDKVVMGISNLSQLDIIKQTRDYVIKHNKLPMSHELDKDVKLIKLTPTLYNEYLNLATISQKRELNNIKYFYTNTIDRNLIKCRRIIDGKFKLETLNLAYLSNKYDLIDIDSQLNILINKLNTKFKDKNSQFINSINEEKKMQLYTQIEFKI